MYLKRLFNYSKLLFFLIVSFFSIQIFINAKMGLTAAPFLHYGMYSGKAGKIDTINVLKIYINNKVLSLNNYLPETNDQIFGPLKKYIALPHIGNRIYNSHINKYLNALMIPHQESSFLLNYSEAKFKYWYKKRIERITNEKIENLEIYLTKNKVIGAQFKTFDSTKIFSWN